MPVVSSSPRRFPVGVHDFAVLRRDGYTFVDKSRFIADILDGPVVTLYPRPRRFGKTLNMTMLKRFFELSGDPDDLFSDLAIWSHDGGRCQPHHRRYPVISLSFKDVKQAAWPRAWAQIVSELQQETQRLVSEHGLVLDRDDIDGRTLRAALSADPSPSALERLLPALMRALAEKTGENVILLLDEYDAPLLTAWQRGYWTEALDFFRVFLSQALKDAPHLFRGVLTGILRVAKENIFSGLNNVSVHSIFDSDTADRFGFTEAEVAGLASLAGLPEAQRAGLKAWYDGYRFGGLDPVVMYNPWSVVHFLAKPRNDFQAYWVNSSANDLARALLTRTAATNGPDLLRLVAGETVTRALRDAVPLQDLFLDDDLLWPLLTYTGYLTPASVTVEGGQHVAELRIPNQEIFAVFRDTFLPLVSVSTAPHEQSPLAKALLGGDVETLEAELGRALVSALSFHDVPTPDGDTRPIEAVYQAFIIGLLLHLGPTHRVVSNREAGYGRADVLVFPKQPGPGVVLELKVITRRDTRETAMARALSQLRARDYAAELRAAGANPIHQLGAVFDGKRCWVERLED